MERQQATIREEPEVPAELISLDQARETLERIKIALETAKITNKSIDWKSDPRFRLLRDFAIQESTPHTAALAGIKAPLLQTVREKEKAVESTGDFVYTTPHGLLSFKKRGGKAILELNGEPLLEEPHYTNFVLDPNGNYCLLTVKTKSIRFIDLETKQEKEISFNGKEFYQYGLHRSGAMYVYRQDEKGDSMIEYIYGEERKAVSLPIEGKSKTVEIRGDHMLINQPKATKEPVANAILFKLDDQGRSTLAGTICIPIETKEIHMEMDESNLYLYMEGGIRVIPLSDFTGKTAISSLEDLDQMGKWIAIGQKMKLRPGGFNRSGDKFVFCVQRGLQRSLVIVDDNGRVVREIPRIGYYQGTPGRKEITVIHEDPFRLTVPQIYSSIEEIPSLTELGGVGDKSAGEELIPGPQGITIPTFAVRLKRIDPRGIVFKGYGGYNHLPPGGNGIATRVALVENGFSEVSINLPGDHGAYEGTAWYERGRGIEGALLTRASFAAVVRHERNQDPKQPICISGGSHGGLTSLATGLNMTREEVAVVVAFNGYYDPKKIKVYNTNGHIWERNQGLEDASPDELERISPYDQVMNGKVDPSQTPTLILVSNLGDVRVNPLETIAMYIALKERGFDAHLIMAEEGEHNSSGITIGETAAQHAAIFEYAFELAKTKTAA